MIYALQNVVLRDFSCSEEILEKKLSVTDHMIRD